MKKLTTIFTIAIAIASALKSESALASPSDCERLDILKLNGPTSAVLEYDNIAYITDFIEEDCNSDKVGRLIDLIYLDERLGIIPSSAFLQSPVYDQVDIIKVKIDKQLSKAAILPPHAYAFSAHDVAVFHMLACQIIGSLEYTQCDDSHFKNSIALGESLNSKQRSNMLDPFIETPLRKKNKLKRLKDDFG